jgi:hypothetical protein
MTEDQEQQVALPTIYEYSVQTYQAMTEQASEESLGAAYGDEEGLVYDGFTTKLIRDLGLPTPYYTKVLKELQRMDCIRQLRRGGSTTTSRWLLMQDPTPTLFQKMQSSRKPGGSRLDVLEQQVRDLRGRLDQAGM